MKHHVPYGSVNSWEVPPSANTGFISFYGKVQIFLTGQKQTHAAIVLDRIILYDETNDTFDPTEEYYEFDATFITRIHTYNSNNVNSYTYTINADNKILISAISGLKKKHLGKPYAVFQIFYFVFRWAMEKINVDVRRWWNPLGAIFLICSELVYRYLMIVATEMKWHDLITFMNQWRPDTCHSGDIRTILRYMEQRGYASENFG